MSAPLSVVIPTLNAAHALPQTLDALLEGVGSGLIAEVVFSDGGSRDATAEVARASGAVWIEGPPGRGGQLRRGIAAATRPWLLVLHADTHLPPGWVPSVLAHMNRDSEIAAAFRLSFRSTHPMARITAGWANWRSRILGLPYGDQGLLISRDLHDRIGGYPDLPLMEDVAIARALAGRIVLLDAKITTAADRYHRDGWIRRGARNLMLWSRYRLGADPALLARRYGPNRD